MCNYITFIFCTLPGPSVEVILCASVIYLIFVITRFPNYSREFGEDFRLDSHHLTVLSPVSYVA